MIFETTCAIIKQCFVAFSKLFGEHIHIAIRIQVAPGQFHVLKKCNITLVERAFAVIQVYPVR